MLGEYEIPNVEPFQDILYSMCFNNPLFTVVNHFGRPIQNLLANDYYVYCLYKGIKGINISYTKKDAEEQQQVLKKMGICMKQIKMSSEIVHDLKKSISLGRPVIVYINSYYFPLSLERYQKENYGHFLMVYGYNDSDSCFKIVDTEIRNCTKIQLSYEDMEKAYKGGLKMSLINGLTKFLPLARVTYYEFGETGHTGLPCKNNNDMAEYRALYKRNMSLKKQDIYRGLNILHEFTCNVRDIIKKEPEIKKILNKEFYELLYGISRNKKSQIYQIEQLFGQRPDITGMIEETINCWNFVNGIFSKYKCTLRYNSKSFSELSEELLKIDELENEITDKLFALN